MNLEISKIENDIEALESNKQSKIASIEVEKSEKEFAQEILERIKTDFDSLPKNQDELQKIDNTVTLKNPSAKSETNNQLGLDKKLDDLDNEARTYLEQAKKRITEIVQTKEFNQIADATPFAGGAKKITESAYGRTLSGEELSKNDRLVRGAKGAVDLGLDFTGIGEVEKGAKLAYVGERIANGIKNNPEAAVNLGKKIAKNDSARGARD